MKEERLVTHFAVSCKSWTAEVIVKKDYYNHGKRRYPTLDTDSSFNSFQNEHIHVKALAAHEFPQSKCEWGVMATWASMFVIIYSFTFHFIWGFSVSKTESSLEKIINTI